MKKRTQIQDSITFNVTNFNATLCKQESNFFVIDKLIFCVETYNTYKCTFQFVNMVIGMSYISLHENLKQGFLLYPRDISQNFQ